MSASARIWWLLAAIAAIGAGTVSLSSQTAEPGAPLTVVSRDGRRILATSVVDGREAIGLDELAAVFDLSIREDAAAGALTVSHGSRTIVLTADQPVASSGGRLISLSSPPRRLGRRWLVPLDFIPRALAPIYESRIDLRSATRLVVVGDLRIPRVVARYEPGAAGIRVALDVDPRVGTSVSQEPGRVLVRFEADGIDAVIPAPPAAAQGLVTGMRVVESGTAVQIDLGPRALSARPSAVAQEGGPYRLAFDLQPGPGPAPEAPTAQAPAVPAEAPPVLAAPARPTVRTIVIDPGHGGEDAGARSASGTLEKDVVLAVARRLEAAIEGRLGVRVLLTRQDDRQVDLDERAAIANNNKADLFISLHANASPRAGTAGVEILYLSRNRFADRVRQLAESQRQTLPVFGGGSREIVFVQWDLAQAYHLDESAGFAGLVQSRLSGLAGAGEISVLQASARVLTGANMPALLIEMGYLSNPDQAQVLASDDFQGRTAQALCDAVATFRERVEEGVPVRAAAPGAPLQAPPQAARGQ